MLKKNVFILLCYLYLIPLQGLASKNTFGVVIDSATFAEAQEALNVYLDAVQQDGLHTSVIHGNWKNPEQVRKKIIELYNSSDCLEGIVLIGDVPIPMIRDAQHLTSAFKIDQNSGRFSWRKTSVPSDRFYDDFDLKFTFIKQDTSDALLFYYSLDPDSPQKVRSDIYSARIKAPINDESKYAMISSYLKKAAAQKKLKNPIDKAFVFTGHGYHTEALDAWSSNLLSYEEQFPQLFKPFNRLKMYDHSMNPNIKYLLMRDLQDENLDMAIFHAHGAYNKQYLVGFEPAGNIGQNVESIKLFLRSKMRTAKRRKKSLDETKAGYQQRYDIPDSWFEGIFSDSLQKADSLLYASQDMHISEIREMKPQAKLIYFDECFNGAFINSPYIAGTYLFDIKSGSVVGIANSVNVLQDVWADQFLGLLNNGVRVGEWLRLQNSLEKHVFGDPTYHFNSATKTELTTNFRDKIKNTRILKKWLKSPEIPLRNLAVAKLYEYDGIEFEKKLVKIFNQDPSANLRLQALKSLADLNSIVFDEILLTAANDPAELIRRFAAGLMGDIGKVKFLEPLAEMRIYDISDRVRFTADQALELIDPLKARDVCLNKINELANSEYRTQMAKNIDRSFTYTNNVLQNEVLVQIADTSFVLKKRVSVARRLRNYRYQAAVPVMIDIILNKNDSEEIRLTLLEALGWYGLNFRRQQIIDSCAKILHDADYSQEFKNVALSTKNRIEQGSNDPITR